MNNKCTINPSLDFNKTRTYNIYRKTFTLSRQLVIFALLVEILSEYIDSFQVIQEFCQV